VLYGCQNRLVTRSKLATELGGAEGIRTPDPLDANEVFLGSYMREPYAVAERSCLCAHGIKLTVHWIPAARASRASVVTNAQRYRSAAAT
jgi:hypothetical protein